MFVRDGKKKKTNVVGKPSLMSVARFEAFSDGVFAIAMTLLVIELKVPDTSGNQLFTEIINLGSHFLSYANSFLVIGILWLNHHALFHFLKRVDRTACILNLLFLMCVAFIPFSSALMGHNPHELSAVIFYGWSLCLAGVAYNLLWFYVLRRYIRFENLMTPEVVRRASFWSAAYPTLYFLSALVAFINPTISIALYIGISIYYLLPSTVDAQLGCFDKS
jgi:uncharacterized membrane protein